MLRAVLFDYYFTLADPTASSKATLAALFTEVLPNLSIDEIDRRRQKWRATVTDQVLVVNEYPSFTTYVDHWTSYGEALLRMLGVSGAGHRYARARLEAHRLAVLFPDVSVTLAELRRRGLRLVIVSDADRAYIDDSLRQNRLDVDGIVTSEDVCCYKPASAPFEAALAAAGVGAGEAVHVGDSPIADVEGARDAGIQPIWVNRANARWPLDTPAPTTISDLSELGAKLSRLQCD